MDNRFLRPLLIVEFLIAIEAFFTVWSEVGGQYHLDLMFWPWKLGIGVASAGLIVAITANLVHNDGSITRRGVMFCSLLISIFLLAGMVTYYYHLNEPVEQEEDQDDDAPAKISGIVVPHELAALRATPLRSRFSNKYYSKYRQQVPAARTDNKDRQQGPTMPHCYGRMRQSYQVRQAFPSRTMGSPSLQPNAFWNSGMFDTVPFTRKRGMA